MLTDHKTSTPECPICGQEMKYRFSVPCDYRKPAERTSYSVFWCYKCDYGHIWERPSEKKIASFYELDHYYTHISDRRDFKAPKSEAFCDRLRVHISWLLDHGVTAIEPSRLRDYLRDKDGTPSVCELGCGAGNDLLSFQSDNWIAWGVEPDPLARRNAEKTGALVFDGVAEYLPEEVSVRKFDVVVMSHVLEHCRDVNKALLNVRHILKDGGIVVLETPNCGALGFKIYQGAWPWSDIPRHLNFFSTQSMDALLKRHGFSVFRRDYCGFCRQYMNAWIHEQRKIWAAFHHETGKSVTEPDFRFRAWLLLLRLVVARPERKYDSLRFCAYKR